MRRAAHANVLATEMYDFDEVRDLGFLTSNRFGPHIIPSLGDKIPEMWGFTNIGERICHRILLAVGFSCSQNYSERLWGPFSKQGYLADSKSFREQRARTSSSD